MKYKSIKTDVLVIGAGSAGQVAALTASENGSNVILLSTGPSATAISTGFLTYAAHEEFTISQHHEAMWNKTGKQLCDRDLLNHFVNAAPTEVAKVLEKYEIPFDPAPRGVRVRKAIGKRGKDLFEKPSEYKDNKDMTSLVMEFSATHGTSLASKLNKAVSASSIDRLKGKAIHLLPQGLGAIALVDNELTVIHSGSVILTTGGFQGLFEFTDCPDSLRGDGQSMALEAGASLVDMEFIQFYPLAVAEEGVPTIFIYPDFPQQSRLINDAGEDIIRKHFGDSQKLGQLDNWDNLSIAMQKEIMAGQHLYFDLTDTRQEDWLENSLTKLFLSRFFPDYPKIKVRVSPIAHYSIGGIRVNVNGQTDIPGVYACGEVTGGLHGANRHGGVALAEAITYGRISGRHAGEFAKKRERTINNVNISDLIPNLVREGKPFDEKYWIKSLRKLNQLTLGPVRSKDSLEELGKKLNEFHQEAKTFGWNNYQDYEKIQSFKRAITLSECMGLSMLHRTESRGTHFRLDYQKSSNDWLKKQIIHFDAENCINIKAT